MWGGILFGGGGGYYPLPPPPKKMGMNKGPNYRFCGKFSAIYLNYKCPKTPLCAGILIVGGGGITPPPPPKKTKGKKAKNNRKVGKNYANIRKTHARTTLT